MLLLRLIAGAILVHELLYLCRDGTDYLKRCFVPTLGLQLGEKGHAALHLALMANSALLVGLPQVGWLHVSLLVLLTLVIASYSLRVSNHLILAWFMVVFVVAGLLDGTGGPGVSPLTYRGIQGLTVLTYFLAFFHKLNRDYLSAERSWSVQLAEFFCWDRNIQDRRVVEGIGRVGIVATLAFEGLLPVLLLIPETRPLGLFLGLVFHFGLALLGIVNFSAMMYAALAAFVPPAAVAQAALRVEGLGAPVLFGLCVPFLLLVGWMTPRHAGRHCPYRMRRPAWILQLGFGVLTCLLLLGAIALYGLPPDVREAWPALTGGQTAILALVLGLFAFNGIGPYLGYKTEFSFAMFSNLRCDPWCHLLFPARWRPFSSRYVRVDRIEGLPPEEELATDGAALLAWRTLSRPEAHRFQLYFLREAVRRLRQVVGRAPRLWVHFEGDPEIFELGRGDGSTTHLRILPVNLFPFTLPLDAGAPHSEQGTVLAERGGRRQLF